MKTSRTQVWAENLGDWSWPGRGGAAAEVLPPPWVPAFPPRREPVLAPPAAPASWQRRRRLVLGMILGALLAACAALALNGQLENVEMTVDARFGLAVPATCPDVPSEFLQPRNTWQDRDAYDQAAAKLARMFATNFEAYAESVAPGIRAAGPHVDD